MELLASSGPLGLLPSSCLVAGVAGLLSHALYFVRGYRVPQTIAIILAHLSAGVLVLSATIARRGVVQGLYAASLICLSYLAALSFSVIVYRIFFHPLRRFPGPFMAKISKVHSLLDAQDGKNYMRQLEWVRKYGDIVRIAPNELMICSLDGREKVHGAQSRASKKDTFYDYLGYHGSPNLDSISDREEHRWRRQVWDKAFNSKALVKYEAGAQEATQDWLDKLDTLKGQPIDTSLYSLLIPFDNMGKMGYSKDFGLIKTGQENRIVHLIEVMFANVSKLGGLTWPIVLAQALQISPEQDEFDKLGSRLADERAEANTPDHEDIMKYFLEDFNSEKPKAYHNKDILYADSCVIMIGGTDTIAAALSYSFYYLARDPALQQALRDELAPVFGKTIPGKFTSADLARVPLVDAVFNEAMRMHNPTCNNGARSAPPEGLEVDGVFIPGGTTVFVGIHNIHRSTKYFKQPDEFIPERWTTRPDLVLDKRAFHPFMVGPFNCVGKRLAVIVLRIVLASTVWHYDFKFAPGEDGTKIHTESKNQLILKAGPLKCVFNRRG